MRVCYIYMKKENEEVRARACACVRVRERERERKRENKQPCFAIIVVICAKETPTTYSTNGTWYHTIHWYHTSK